MPDAVQPEAPPAAVVETHTATLFFVGDRVYKLKKPVDLGFVDFSTREKRLAACHLEVDLNRRLAPDVYEGVADITGPDGALCDHLVVMHRMPEHLRLARCVERGDDVADALRAIAHQVVALHASAPSDPAWHHVAEIEGPDGLRRNWADGFGQLRPTWATVDREWERPRRWCTATSTMPAADRRAPPAGAEGSRRPPGRDVSACPTAPHPRLPGVRAPVPLG
jgi:aminoglycoside phosphotransferase family enzyme